MESGGSNSGGSHNVIPESVMESVRRTSRNVEDVEANLEEFLSYCDKETLSDLEPLERANVLLMIAKANTSLFALRLRCKGVDPDDHPIKREFERLSLYEEKLKQCMNLNKVLDYHRHDTNAPLSGLVTSRHYGQSYKKEYYTN